MDKEKLIKEKGLRPTKLINAPNGISFVVYGTLKHEVYKDKAGPVIRAWKGGIAQLQTENPHLSVYNLNSAYLPQELKTHIKTEFKNELE